MQVGLPPGKLICTRNENRYKWFQSDGHSSSYIHKKNRPLAEQLAIKKYLSIREKELQHELKALEFYLRHHSESAGQAEQLLLDPRYPEQLIHRTASGIYVRSKSEAIISMFLYINKIPFRYEHALELGDIIVHPDFTIRHPVTGEYFYWEHFGMMDDPDYRENTFSKLERYSYHEIYPSMQLITTFETKESPLASDMVEALVKYYFL